MLKPACKRNEANKVLASMTTSEDFKFDNKNRKVILAIVILLVIYLLMAVLYYSAFRSPIILNLGHISVSLEITNSPACSPFIRGCLIEIPSSQLPHYFTVWGAVATYKNDGVYTSARRVLSVPIL